MKRLMERSFTVPKNTATGGASNVSARGKPKNDAVNVKCRVLK
jgi:hypothetical protein